MHYIYCLTNQINGKKYIGRTNDIRRRMTQHKNDSFNPNCARKYDTPLAHAIRKYGWEAFNMEVLQQNEDKDIINQSEQEYILLYDTYSSGGYNASIGGEFGAAGREYTSKFREQLPDIIVDLKSGMKHKDIAHKYDISIPYVSEINNGTRLRVETETYPLFLSHNENMKLVYPKIIELLATTKKSMNAIARELHISKDTVQRVNQGNIRAVKDLSPDFPIRKQKKGSYKLEPVETIPS